MIRKLMVPAVLLPLLLALSACGSGADRSALAKKTVQTYWYDLGHVRISQAYKLLSPGVQSSLTLKDYQQNMFSFLESTSGLGARIGKPNVVGDCALVPVGLTSPKAPGGIFSAYQHLYWVNGGWRITEANGGLSQHPGKLTCPTGA